MTRGGPSAWSLGVGLTTLRRKNKFVRNILKEPWEVPMEGSHRINNTNDGI
jgi:hypothetical protein